MALNGRRSGRSGALCGVRDVRSVKKERQSRRWGEGRCLGKRKMIFKKENIPRNESEASIKVIDTIPFLGIRVTKKNAACSMSVKF